ncbi:MAG: UvrB/UvrC motif-containing protein [Clostridia bacterium]|nr:UvrB/UvrC motif-containing protein [Clostridia bacterium]
MKCQKCQTREATRHITEVINGKKQELHLCSECAAASPEFQAMKHNMDFGIGDFLGGIFGSKPKNLNGESSPRTSICPDCGMPFEEFLQKGRLGCGTCYSVFRNRLERPLRQIHGVCEHVGKVPSRMGGRLRLDRQVSHLEAELNAAVMKQDFERAAELRDRIKELKAQNQEEA